MKLNDRVALVTGAGAGIGRAIAIALSQEGANIGVNDVNKDAIEQTIQMVEDAGGSGLALQADVGDPVQVKSAFDKIKSTWGTIDILVNNAGISIPKSWNDYKEQFHEALFKAVNDVSETGKVQTSWKVTSSFKDEWWQKTLNVHLDGTFYCTREALNIMEEKASGKIVNIASVCGMEGAAGLPAYSAAKGAIIALTKAVAKEVIGSGIVVNAVAPGYIETPLLDNMDERAKQLIIAQTPAGRLGTPQEIASLVVYLVSNEADFMVGQIVSPNGGLVI
jgi:3-oxoacyl-[acyl-carrier protein] reductase